MGGSVTLQTEANGRYEGYLLWGDYSVQVDHSTIELDDGVTKYLRYSHDSNLHVDQGATTEIYDILIEKAFENSTVYGRVTIGGVGTVAQVQFMASSPSAMDVSVLSDQDGNYSADMTPGDYTVYVHRPTGHYTHLGELTIVYNTTGHAY